MRAAWIVLAAACCPPHAAKVAVAPPPPLAEPAAKVVVPPPPPPDPLAARTVDAVDHQFGLTAPDPYRWMEGSANAELTTWLRANGDDAAKHLAALPSRDELLKRVRDLGFTRASVWGAQTASDVTIYTTQPATAQIGKLAVRDATGQERILVDPEALGTKDAHVSLEAYQISPDGKYVGYILSPGGSEVGAIHVMTIATGKELPDVIDRVWGEFAPVWEPRSASFFYTQLAPAGGDDLMANMIVKVHALGQKPEIDSLLIGRTDDYVARYKLAPQEFPSWYAVPGSNWIVITFSGARSEMRLALANNSPPTLVAGYEDGVDGYTVHGDRLYVSSFKGAPNKRIVSVPLAAPDLSKARVELAEDDAAALSYWVATKDAIYAVYDAGGRARLVRLPWGGKAETIKLPVDGWISDAAGDLRRDGIIYQVEGWTTPGKYFRYDPKKKTSIAAGFGTTAVADYTGYTVEEVEVDTADGAKVPLSIIHARDLALDGSHPTLVGGYGGYGISEHPGYGVTRMAWLEKGGVVATCHVRGGGEKGRKWQDDGSHAKKLNGIHDLLACGQYLVDKKYTSHAHLAAEGGSAGGILIGRAITEDPTMFRAVHISVGMVNPLRMLAADNGANQIGELGDPRTEQGFKDIYAMDPLQHVKPGTAYPAVLFTVGLNDHRVAPWMTAKMAAALRVATTSGQPIWLRTEGDAGHGIGSTRDQAYAETADVDAFLLDRLR